MSKYLWPMMAAITLNVAMSSAYADDGMKYPASDESQQTQPVNPSIHAVAHKAMKSADRKLSRDVRKAVANGGAVDMLHLGIVARLGKITLVGSVPEEGQIDLATQLA
jgi:hyperosmotically inducible periplasmic protein